MNLEEFTDNQLQAELLRRREEQRSKELKERNDRNLLIQEHIDTLLLFVKHIGKCDDENLVRHRMCARCELLECKRYNLPLDENMDMEITIFKSVL